MGRTQVDDRPTTVVGEAVVAQSVTRFDRGDGGDHERPGSDDIVGLADVERHRGPLALHEQPGRRPQLVRHGVGQARRRTAVAVEGRIRHHLQVLRARPARQRAVLEAMIAQVFHATDPDAGRDVRHDPPGQDRDVDARGSLGRHAREGPQAALRDGLDDRDRGVARPDRQVPSKSATTSSGGGAAARESSARATSAADEIDGGPSAAVTA